MTTPGPFTVTVRAIDLAGNVDELGPVLLTAVADGWRQVSVGETHVCGLRTSGELWCWGSNNNFQLGNGDGAPSETSEPVVVRDPDGFPDLRWQQVSTGREHSCAIDESQRLWCWGSGAHGRLGLGEGIAGAHSLPQPVTGEAEWRMVSAGAFHTCGIRTDGSLWCWGLNGNNDGRLGVGDGTNRFVPTRVGEDNRWVHVSAGANTSCGVWDTGEAWCWGANNVGQLVGGSTGSSANYKTPIRFVDTVDDFRRITTSDNYSCAVRADGSVTCRGSTFQPGRGSSVAANRNVDVVAGNTSANGRSEHTCTLRHDPVAGESRINCWGFNEFGQTSADPSPSSGQVTLPGVEWAQLDVARNRSCAVTWQGELRCWGRNEVGRLGIAVLPDKLAPNPEASAAGNWETVGTPWDHACAVQDDGTLWCWGRNQYGQLGLGHQGFRSLPARVGAAEDWLTVSTHVSHSCGIREDAGTGDRSLWCWGRHGSSSTISPLGSGNEMLPANCIYWGPGIDRCSDAPVREYYAWTDWAQVDVGQLFSCGIRDDGLDRPLLCWGSNASGRLGTGGGSASVPVTEATQSTDWVLLSLGSEHACGIRDSGTVRTLHCWGNNGSGRLGVGDTSSRNLPVTEATGSDDWLSVSAGMNHTCALRLDGSLWCWGNNGRGQLGLDPGSTDQALEPTEVSGGHLDWVDVSAGSSFTCGIREDIGTGDRTLWCWGSADADQLGSGGASAPDLCGSIPCATVPQAVDTSITDWVDVGAGLASACARRADHTTWCWGDNGFGQLGDADAWRETPQTLVLPTP